MVDVKELQKALKQFPRPPYSIEHDSEKWNAWTEDVINWFDELKRLFSAFQRTFFEKCEYVNAKGEAAFLCAPCRNYHGFKRGCEWKVSGVEEK